MVLPLGLSCTQRAAWRPRSSSWNRGRKALRGWKPTTHGPDAGVAGPAGLAGKGERQVAALGEAADDASFERYAGGFGLGINEPAQFGRSLVEACFVEAVLVDVEPRCAIAVGQIIWCSRADGGEPLVGPAYYPVSQRVRTRAGATVRSVSDLAPSAR